MNNNEPKDVGTIARKILNDAAIESMQQFETFNIVTYAGGTRVKVGHGFMNAYPGGRPKIVLDKNEILKISEKKFDAYFYPRTPKGDQKKSEEPDVQ